MSTKQQISNQQNAAAVARMTAQMRDLSPQDRLQFAKWLLRGIFSFFILSIMVWLYQSSCGETLLEICRTGLLPIASFVIGDYFGSRTR
jgi:hypothetical protein